MEMVLFLFRKTDWYLTSVVYIMLGGVFSRSDTGGGRGRPCAHPPGHEVDILRDEAGWDERRPQLPAGLSLIHRDTPRAAQSLCLHSGGLTARGAASGPSGSRSAPDLHSSPRALLLRRNTAITVCRGEDPQITLCHHQIAHGPFSR